MNTIVKGEQAERIINDSVFQEAVSEVSKALVHEWEHSTKKARREEIWMQQKALKKVIENLAGYIENGKMDKRLTETKEGWIK